LLHRQDSAHVVSVAGTAVKHTEGIIKSASGWQGASVQASQGRRYPAEETITAQFYRYASRCVHGHHDVSTQIKQLEIFTFGLG
jgi:hypothetical protein